MDNIQTEWLMQDFGVMQRSSPNRITLVVFLLLLLGCAGVVLWMIRPYLLAIAIGGIFALLAKPAYLRLLAMKVGPKVASLIITLIILFLVLGPISTFFTLAVQQGAGFAQGLADRHDVSFHNLVGRIAHWKWIHSFIEDPVALEKYLGDLAKNIGRETARVLLGLASNVPKIVLQLVLAGISCFFWLLDGSEFTQWMADKIPLDSDVRAHLTNSFKDTAVSVIWATLAAAAAQSAVILTSFLILGIPSVFLAAGAVFILAWIPMIGSAPVWITGALYLYFKGEMVKCVIMVAFGIFTSVIDNVVRPLVLKGRGGMHPFISLIAIFGGIQMFGISGVFLGPILAAVMIALLQTWPSVAERFGVIKGNE